jgi:UDP-GlcNAc:undecaprenyl-phosphate GlcNAc-1-phosphate transferase
MSLLAVSAFTCALSFSMYLLLIPIAVTAGLVDKPDARKRHKGEVPLVGGVGVFLSLIVVGPWLFPVNTVTSAIAVASMIIVMLGVCDDKCDLSVRFRLLVQLIASCVLVFAGGIQVESLGNLLGWGELKLGWLSAPFTILAIMTAMNAFNMIDGIDGLLGGLSLVAFLGVAFLAVLHFQPVPLLIALIMIAALLVFLAYNLGSVALGLRKIFMGDGGSMFIGMLVVCLLALMTLSGPQTNFEGALDIEMINERPTPVRPVAVLWLIAIPIMDMFGTMARRIVKRESPFKPDRDHLHHIFMRAGFSSAETLVVITLSGVLLVLFGLVLEILRVPEPVVALLYIGVFVVYAFGLRRVWRIVAMVRLLRRPDEARE